MPSERIEAFLAEGRRLRDAALNECRNCDSAAAEAFLRWHARLVQLVRIQAEELRKWEALGEKVRTISVRANSYGPGFPPNYADSLWEMARETERIGLAAVEERWARGE